MSKKKNTNNDSKNQLIEKILRIKQQKKAILLITALRLSRPLPDGFLPRDQYFEKITSMRIPGRKKGTRDQAPEASADQSDFLHPCLDGLASCLRRRTSTSYSW